MLLIVTIVNDIAMARTAPSTARHSRIHPVVIIIILVNYIIPVEWSNGKKVTCYVLPAAWRLDLCPEIIASVPRETLTGAFNLP
jgi:hypothetical protein